MTTKRKRLIKLPKGKKYVGKSPNELRIEAAVIVGESLTDVEYFEKSLRSYAYLVDHVHLVDTSGKYPDSHIAKSAQRVSEEREFDYSIYKYQWQDSFAEARNYAFSCVSEHTDWILIVDADEVLSDKNGPVNLHKLCAQVEQAAISLQIRSLDRGKISSAIAGERLFKKSTFREWRYSKHNRPMYEGAPVIVKDLEVIHYGYDLDKPEMIEEKRERDRKALRRDLAAYPGDAYVLTNFAKHKMQLDPPDYSEALKYARLAISVTEHEDPKTQQEAYWSFGSYDVAAMCCMVFGDTMQARKYAEIANRVIPTHPNPAVIFSVCNAIDGRTSWIDAVQKFVEYQRNPEVAQGMDVRYLTDEHLEAFGQALRATERLLAKFGARLGENSGEKVGGKNV